MKTRTDVIQFLIDTFGYKKYLEVGVQYKDNWDKIKCEEKTGVEPQDLHDPNIHPLTSDQFFEKNTNKYDIIFIDGDHNHSQSTKDAYNALKVINDGGCIVFHDALPYCIEYTNEYHCGTVFKSLLELRSELAIDICTFEEDHGVCIVRKDVPGEKIECRDLSWEEFYPRRKELLNVMNSEELQNHLTK